MTDPYTPTTEEVRALYDERTEPGEFDRWLAAHDAEVAAKADLRGFNRGYGQANREWQLSGDGRGMV